jgi:hypothetical protein
MDWAALLARLSEPFPPAATQWRAGSTTRDKKRAQALPYAEPRVYEDRLNALCPGEWAVTFKPWGEHRIICELTIHGVTRSSTGEESDGGFAPGTAAEAQAFKRACSKFGLGRYLYDLPAQWVAYDAGKKCLLETPQLGKVPAQPGTLSRERAAEMHKQLGKLGLSTNERYKIASAALEREVKSFTALTEDEALTVWNACRREARRLPASNVMGKAAAA